ncbi:putative alpha-L-fucosidase [Pogonomyrmex barbatus]|uniref:alpha-L-fucosidase n=1 Tax=Pogonomyrmex barbatus TaxID=144034 RepID=A0A8N1S3M6_9HYME|nr:putative alpha-L-fucosidase [Pogonomyrmex barbatus]
MLLIYNLCTVLILCVSVKAYYNVIARTDEENNFISRSTEIPKYVPTWSSLDNRSLPSWYDDAKLGIFIHWGVFSVPSFGSEWFWNNWKEETKSVYVHIFFFYELGELAEAIRNKTDIRFGLYHSLYEWYNPLYITDKKNNFTTDRFITHKIMPELRELVETYKPEIIWSDGDWEASDTYWKSKEFLAWLYNESPVKDTVVVNDRWGSNMPCHHGGFFTCSDRFNPGVLLPHKWENCMTIDKKSWGFRRNAALSEYYTLAGLVKELVITVSCGGNLLMNVGPTKDGIITPIYEERLRGIGAWLAVNGEAIYDTKPWTVQNDTLTGSVWYTISKNEKQLFASILEWPDNNILSLGSLKLSTNSQIYLLGYSSVIPWKQSNDKLEINLPPNAHKGQPAWVLKIEIFQSVHTSY